MRMNPLLPEFEDALPVIHAIEQAGFEAYFVGGSLRDALLHLPIHDVDIATSAYPEEIKQIFQRTVDTGIQHGTVTVLMKDLQYEITTFRTESTYQDFRRPDKVTFVRNLSDDLQRRDFTINAIAMAGDGTLIDQFNGLDDLKKGILRAVGDPNERFKEDALRMMRGVRFESQLAFTIEPVTLQAIKDAHLLLSKIAIERVHVEFIKLMLGQNYHQGIQSLIETGLVDQCPELSGKGNLLGKMLELPVLHLISEESVWTLVAVLLQIDCDEVSHFLNQWKSSNAMVNAVQRSLTIQHSLVDNQLTSWLLFENGKQALLDGYPVAQIFGVDHDLTYYLAVYEKLPIKNRKELAINGKELISEAGMKPGPQLGDCLNKLLRQVIEDGLPNEKAILLKAVQSNNG